MKNSHRLVEVKYLRTFYSVATLKSFSSTADSLFMTQPLVSQHIKKIESILGVTLFERRNEFELSSHGKILLTHTKKILALYRRLDENLNKAEQSSSVSIAIEDSISNNIVNPIINQLSAMGIVDFSISKFSTNSSPQFGSFDLIFSSNFIPEEQGRTYQLRIINYVIAYDKEYSCQYRFNRVVYFDQLSKLRAKSILKSHNFDTSHVKSWISTNSSKYYQSELLDDETICIFPEFTLLCDRFKKITIEFQIKMYAWCRNQLSSDLKDYGFIDKIKNL
ncbi:LysR family transcriptional regulator [Vibrio splendidus]|uniref:LysR family transcriptional regulator n=1 Tax=Vibrio splendidus TaxID=29497 RepID=UPI002235FF45|nr:LysR family transcriptional regulator [Vibrio splendidus]MCW4444185.1 LysR family transcriptional regulator [Vibrio splendidus]